MAILKCMMCGGQLDIIEDETDYCWWWLRSTGSRKDLAAGVDVHGRINKVGHEVNYGNNAVRPAIWIGLGR